jgi:anti-sigma regulatory factor (Ser/Thr protein kinase)
MGSPLIEVRDEASVSLVRQAVRQQGQAIGMSLQCVETLAAAASELGFNQLNHARLGEMEVAVVERAGHVGLEVRAVDQGPGIADPPAALAGRLVGKGLGVGLAAFRHAVDEVDTDVRRGEGSTVVGRRFVRQPGRRLAPRHPEVAIEGRALPGEHVSGDDAVVIRRASGVLVAVADGLGHGAAAHLASRRAMDRVAANADRPLDEVLAVVDRDLHGTRGAAMTLARVDVEREEVHVAGIGNIDTRLEDHRGNRHRHIPRSGTLGVRRVSSSTPIRTYPFPEGAVLVLCSDGIRSRDRDSTPGLSRHPAVWTAHHLLQEHVRASDDALVLVLR